MIRPAVAGDAESIDRVHVRAWERAYGDFVAPDRMIGAREPEDRLARWRERLDDEVIRTWVFELDGFLAGFASAGGGTLRALYVDPGAQGAGVGTALLEHAEAVLRAEGAAEAELWVYRENEHGRRFYESHGWELVPGSEKDDDWAAPGVRYRKVL